MEQCQLRLIDEFVELNERVGKLYTFLNDKDGKVTELAQEEQDDMGCQFNAMVLYQRFLQSRIVRAGLVEELKTAMREKYGTLKTESKITEEPVEEEKKECECKGECKCKKEKK